MTLPPITPGPWTVDAEGCVTNPTGISVALVVMPDDHQSLVGEDRPAVERECQANAVAIAALPELLAAARVLLMHWDNGVDFHTQDVRPLWEAFIKMGATP